MAPVDIENARWGRGEFAAIMACAWQGSRTGPSIAALAASAGKMLDRTVIPVNSGRGALRIALGVLMKRQPARRRVIIPEYVCPAVPEIIRGLGLEPFAVAVGPDLNLDVEPLIRSLDNSVLAVVPVHMYGAIVPAEQIQQAAREAGAATIDDAAHVMGIADAAGYVPGTAGTFGLISFAQAKSIVCGYSGSGGLLIVNDASIAADLGQVRLDPARHSDILNFILTGGRSGVGNRFWRVERFIDRLVPHEREGFDVRVTAIANLHAALALAQLHSLPARIEDKKRVASEYRDALQGLSGVTFPQFAPSRYLSKVVLQCGSVEQRNRLRQHLQSRRIATRAGYPPPDAATSRSDGLGEMPLVELPGGFGMTRAAIRHVASVVGEWERL